MANKRAQVKSRFLTEGVSIAEWARARGFDQKMVYRVLAGEVKGKRGKGHEIAVALGLKAEPADMRFRPDIAA